MLYTKTITCGSGMSQPNAYFSCLLHSAFDFLEQSGIHVEIYAEQNARLELSRFEMSVKNSIRGVRDLLIKGRIGYWRPKSFTMIFEMYDEKEEKLFIISTLFFHFLDADDSLLPIPKEFTDRIFPNLL